MIIDIISDLHGYYPTLDGGDLLIVAGDLTATDTHIEYLNFLSWLQKQNYKQCIFIAGNHDVLLQKGEISWMQKQEYKQHLFIAKNNDVIMQKGEIITSGLDKITYLCDSGIEFKGLKIWGTPWTKTFPGMNPRCKAFTCDTEEELEEKFKNIPSDTDILISHGPKWGMHDTVGYINTGSKYLSRFTAKNVDTLKLFVCGHIHEGYGVYDIRHIQEMYNDPYTPVFVNASHVNRSYEPVNQPVRIVL